MYHFFPCQIFAKYLVFCGIGVKNADMYETSQLEIRRNQVMKWFGATEHWES